MMNDQCGDKREELIRKLRDRDQVVIGGLLYCGPLMQEVAAYLETLPSNVAPPLDGRGLIDVKKAAAEDLEKRRNSAVSSIEPPAANKSSEALDMAMSALRDIERRAPGTRGFFDYDAFITDVLAPAMLFARTYERQIQSMQRIVEREEEARSSARRSDKCESCGYTESHDPNCPRPPRTIADLAYAIEQTVKGTQFEPELSDAEYLEIVKALRSATPRGGEAELWLRKIMPRLSRTYEAQQYDADYLAIKDFLESSAARNGDGT